MKLKPLYEGQKFRVVCISDGNSYPVEDFLSSDDENIQSYLDGLKEMIEFAAENGLAACSSKWLHEANKEERIYEFIKGPIRVFFFKGQAETIAVCTGYTRKSGKKADKSSVKFAVTKRKAYFKALQKGEIEFEDKDEDEDEGD